MPIAMNSVLQTQGQPSWEDLVVVTWTRLSNSPTLVPTPYPAVANSFTETLQAWARCVPAAWDQAERATPMVAPIS